MHNKSVPDFLMRKKVFRVFEPNLQANSEVYSTERGNKRKEKRIFTFCDFAKKTSEEYKQTYTPKEADFKKQKRVQSNYFPSNKTHKENLGPKRPKSNVSSVSSELKREYNRVLGLNIGPIEEEEPVDENGMSMQEYEDLRLKERIKKKQMTFSELKKDALKILIG